MTTFDDPERLDRYADLIAGFAANVQRGQVVKIISEIGKEPLTRAVARQAYKRGAAYVDVLYFDLHVKHARIAYADEEALDYVPPYLGREVLTLGELGAARIAFSGQSFPGLLADLDPVRAGKDQLPRVKESSEIINARTTNWTGVPCPTRPWAQLVYPDLDPEAAWQELSDAIAFVCRLDSDDPIEAWRARIDELRDVRARLNAQRFDAVRFRGPGTDLTVGLFPTSDWTSVGGRTVSGIEHMENLPSEEIFTTPDPQRVNGVVRATRPLSIDGTLIEGLEVEFRDGRAVRIDAERGADVLRGNLARDEGAARLGEVALVDGSGRVGALDTVFFDTLLDENTASHIALGGAYAFTVGDEHRDSVNESAIHIDFMIGGPEVDVFALDGDGNERPLLIRGDWKL